MKEDMQEASRPTMPPKARKVLKHIEMQEGENGGHMMTHHFDSYDHKPEVHVFGPTKAIVELPEGHPLQHIAKHMGIPHKAMETENFADFKNAENKKAVASRKA